MSSVEDLPDFSTWKMINDTFPALVKQGYNQSNVERLALLILKSKHISKIFFLERNSSLSHENYTKLAGKYNTFTTWILGRFFHLLSIEKLSEIHKLIVEVQICILEHISKTNVRFFSEMGEEYGRGLEVISQFIQTQKAAEVLQIFVTKNDSDCDLMRKLDLAPTFVEITKENVWDICHRLVNVFKYLLNESFNFLNFDTICIRNIANLLTLMSKAPFTVKFSISHVFMEILQKVDLSDDDLEWEIGHRLRMFGDYFEQIVYSLYNGLYTISATDFQNFENLVLKFLSVFTDSEKITGVSQFLLDKTPDSKLSPNSNIVTLCETLQLRKPLCQVDDHEFDKLLDKAIKHYRCQVLSVIKYDIFDSLQSYSDKNPGQPIFMYKKDICQRWSSVCEKIPDSLPVCADNICALDEFLSFLKKLFVALFEVRIKFNMAVQVVFFETSFFAKFLSFFNNHLCRCKTTDFGTIFDFLCAFNLCENSTILFDIFSFLLDKNVSVINQTDIPPPVRKEFLEFLRNCAKFQIDKTLLARFLTNLICQLSSGLFQTPDIQAIYTKSCKHFMTSQDPQIQTIIIRNAPQMFTLFAGNSDVILSQILTPALSSSDTKILTEAALILPQIICMASCNFKKVSVVRGDRLDTRISCDECDPQKSGDGVEFSFEKIDVDVATLSGLILTSVLKFLTADDRSLKMAALAALPCCASHVLKFHAANSAKVWIEVCGDVDGDVRRRFAEVIGVTIKRGQENQILSDKIKDETLDNLFATLLKLTRKSLQETDVDLQKTLLLTVDELLNIKNSRTVLPIAKILTYFIIIPTSRHPLIAVNKFFILAENHQTRTTLIYKHYRQEMCELIVHLCAVNQSIIKYSLNTSLCRISVALEFFSSKDFVTRECQHLLPFLVAKLTTHSEVKQLIEEAAVLVDTDLSDLLKATYGVVFLHTLLNLSKDDFKKCMSYVESSTNTLGLTLRKKNFWEILNELLLNFHDKRDMVLLALSLLKTEDTDQHFDSLQDYLQPRMLGLLQHFDFKLMAKTSNCKDLVLLSLSDLFKFMGPKNITPLRIKIIAMLRTVDYQGFSEQIAEVWESFVKNCDVDSLGPQLATIFVSLLPVSLTCLKKTTEVFRYLLIENETKIKDFVKDLFFIDDTKIDSRVAIVIKKHLKAAEKDSLKERIAQLLPYLTHETVEVRLESFRGLKGLMEKNREELDRIILGYNGIDEVVVDLIDGLMAGCREKDPRLRLACGEVIGELGAVEPAHLPRKYALDWQNFTFSIGDDGFIVNVLNELTKAFQGEKNTINMDRLAVAIQEMLKVHEISPDASSNRNYLWDQFPVSQQELMLPLLTSKYIISQPEKSKFPCPIYGTSDGASFHSWIYNWVASLISTLPQQHQSLLIVCLPAMKQDQKILMQFLPLIVLHSITEPCNSREKSFTEIQVVTNAFTNRPAIDPKFLEVRPFATTGAKATIDPITPEEVKQTQCTKIVFIVLDFLERWVREWQWQKGLQGKDDANLTNIKKFLGRFCKLQLARCNFHCEEYPRALMYLEDYMQENPDEISNHLWFLAEIYAQLDEPDGVTGVTALQHCEPSIEQRILALEISGKLWDAISCYENIPPPLKLNHIRGLMQCYLDLDNVNTALHFARGYLDQELDFGNMLFEFQAEPMWRLGRYEDLNNLLEKPELVDNHSWGVQIGRALLCFEKSDRQGFGVVLERLKCQQVDYLGAASLQQGFYQHGYEYVSRMHILNELQQVERATYEILLKPNDVQFVEEVVKSLSKEWELRIKVVMESVRIIEPLLCLRRVALEQSKRLLSDRAPNALPLINILLGELWLLSAKTARSAGVHQQAYTYSLRAEEFAPASLFLEKAELHWMREEHEQALTILKRGIDKVCLPGSSSALPVEKKKLCAQAKLLMASYNDSISNFDTEIIIVNYRDAVKMYDEWEKSLVCLAQFYDRIYQQIEESEKDGSRGTDMQIHMINYFGKSLQYGTTYVYQSLPRLLSIWFDYGTRLFHDKSGQAKERQGSLLKMTKLVDTFLERLPIYIFLTAFSQIVSRICHPQKEVYKELKSIVIKLLLKYPQQSMWTIISVIKSGYSVRAKRCAEIFADPRLKTMTMTKLVQDFTNLAEKLIELCNKDIPGDVDTITVSQLLRTLPRMLNKEDFSEIMIPTHKFRKLILPNPDFSSSQHNPFPNHYVYITGIDEEVTVLRSLQRPRKVSFRGSDGKSYIQMLKPKDDLRKDFRLMEFNDIVNQLLSREPEARQRRLNIRLYSVSPLNEECGLIEWVPNLVGLRPTLMELYKQRGSVMKPKELRDASCNIRDSLARKREIFTRVFLAKHPPVLGEWFRRTFPDAQSWVFARTAYTRTLAVMSMVGYILGLGDRHGENILLDSICGDAVHVDFNCLFNKGESFEWPERVPFRLTQNMIAAMGPLGVEGIFRKSCACTLRVLRTNATTLMSIVTPFVYDPLVSWPRNAGASVNAAERTNEQAVEHIKNIELRLQGIIKTKARSHSIPLSVDGQVNNLINEAMSVDNLCQMYVGWGPYL